MANRSAYKLCYVEIDVDYCALEYGETNDAGTCPAVLGVDSAIKCFNTLKTCAVRGSFENQPVTLRFAQPTDYLPRQIRAIPCIVSVSMSPGVIAPGRDMGQRSSLTVEFSNLRWNDTGIGGDKYLAERGYNAFGRGTYWGKFRARQPFLRGRPLRLIRGHVGQALEDMEIRHYVIDSFDGPGLDGRFRIVAKDVLKLTDGSRAQAPRLSRGRLAAGISNSTGSASLAPTGIGNLEYPASGYLNIGGQEVVAFTRSNDALTLTRGQWNTQGVAHQEGARAQLCLHYNGVDPADYMNDLFTVYAGGNPAFVPLSQWKQETSTNLGNVYTTLIAEPTDVDKLMNEMIEQAALVFGWDDINQLILLRVLRNVLPSAERFHEGNYLLNSFRSREQQDSRISQVWIFFGQLNPLRPLDDQQNYLASEIVADLESESNYGSPAVKKIYSRLIPFGGRDVATKLGQILLGRYVNPPRRINFDVFRDGTDVVPRIGIGYQFDASPLEDATGAPASSPIQITSINPKAEEYSCEAEELLFVGFQPEDQLNRRLIIDHDANNVNVRTLYETIYHPPTAENIQNGVNLTVIIETGVTVAGTVPAGRSLDIGEWPYDGDTPFPITVEVRGRLAGRPGNGGKGGNGGNISGNNALNAQNGQPGLPGGTALYTRHPITLKYADGEIFGGPGGGGGGGGGGGAVSANAGGQSTRVGGAGGGGGGRFDPLGGALPGPRGTGGGSLPHATPGNHGFVGGTPNGGNGGANKSFTLAFSGRGGTGGAAGSDWGEPGSSASNNAQGGVGNVSAGNRGNPGDGGAAGAAIDGWSFVTVEGEPGDLRGPTIN